MSAGVSIAGVEAAIAALTASRDGGWANPHLVGLSQGDLVMASIFLCALSKALLDSVASLAYLIEPDSFHADEFVQDLALTMQRAYGSAS